MIQIKFLLYITELTISEEVNAMAEALNTIAQNDFIETATPITISFFATTLVWTHRNIWINYLWEAEDKLEFY
tara:strand:- start:134 stop:352 length:219 start_codon:yes stop_codon:yes gene_type:complete